MVQSVKRFAPRVKSMEFVVRLMGVCMPSGINIRQIMSTHVTCISNMYHLQHSKDRPNLQSTALRINFI